MKGSESNGGPPGMVDVRATVYCYRCRNDLGEFVGVAAMKEGITAHVAWCRPTWRTRLRDVWEVLRDAVRERRTESPWRRFTWEDVAERSDGKGSA